MNERALSSILVTGGAGFIGSNLIRTLLTDPACEARIVNMDALTYAGNEASLADMAEHPRYAFEHVDIRDKRGVERVFADHGIDTVIHLAAESHVDRSIDEPLPFVTTNVVGTGVLLDAAREAWGARTDVLFHHVSTDEVYGSLGAEGLFDEASPYDPRSPYAASKAASDHLVRAYGHTYGIPVTLSNCANNYGPYQFPEKFIPLLILKLMDGSPLPIYGDGSNIRDWMHVEDHARALWTIVKGGRAGQTWTVGARNELSNLDVAKRLCTIFAAQTGEDPQALIARIAFVADRPGHDARYGIDPTRIESELAWKPEIAFDEGLAQTVAWIREHPTWIAGIRDGSYLERRGAAPHT